MAEETKENGQSSGSSEWQGAVDFDASEVGLCSRLLWLKH